MYYFSSLVSELKFLETMGSISRRPRCWRSTATLAHLDEYDAEVLKKKWLNLSSFNAMALKKRSDGFEEEKHKKATLMLEEHGDASTFRRAPR
ncbi:hypothetical protein S245_035608 [Arachis hypogaea]